MLAAVNEYCSAIAPLFITVYESSIDLGAHPNVQGADVMTAPAPPDSNQLDRTVLASGDPEAIRLGMQRTMAAGVVAINLANATLGDRFKGGASFAPAIRAASVKAHSLL